MQQQKKNVRRTHTSFFLLTKFSIRGNKAYVWRLPFVNFALRLGFLPSSSLYVRRVININIELIVRSIFVCAFRTPLYNFILLQIRSKTPRARSRNSPYFKWYFFFSKQRLCSIITIFTRALGIVNYLFIFAFVNSQLDARVTSVKLENL